MCSNWENNTGTRDCRMCVFFCYSTMDHNENTVCIHVELQDTEKKMSNVASASTFRGNLTFYVEFYVQRFNRAPSLSEK